MCTHVLCFFVSSVVGTKNDRICRRIKAQISLNWFGTHFLPWYIFGSSSATESLNSTGTCTTRYPHQGFLFLPLCLVGKSCPPGLVENEARLSQPFFRHSCHHGFCPFHGHCHTQRPAAPTTLSLPAQQCWSIGSIRRGMAHSSTRDLPLSSEPNLGSNSNSHKYRAPSSQSRSQLRNQSTLSQEYVRPPRPMEKTSHRDTCLTVEVPTPGSQRTKNVYVCTACDQTFGLCDDGLTTFSQRTIKSVTTRL